MPLADVLRSLEDRRELPVAPAVYSHFNFFEEAEKRLTNRRETPPATAKTKFRISGIPKLCAREEVLRSLYSVTKVEVINSRLQRTFDFGTAFHSLVQNEWFGKWGWLIGNWKCLGCGGIAAIMSPRPPVCSECDGDEFVYIEYAVEKAGITGHPDGILRVNGFDRVMELKTTNSNNFKYVTEFLRAPMEAHMDQIQLYMWVFGMSHGVVFYFEKDESKWAAFPVEFQKERVQGLLDKVAQVRSGISSKTPPPRKVCATKDCARAKVCPVRQKCFDLK